MALIVFEQLTLNVMAWLGMLSKTFGLEAIRIKHEKKEQFLQGGRLWGKGRKKKKTEKGTEREWIEQKKNCKEENQSAEITVKVKIGMFPQERNNHGSKPELATAVQKDTLSLWS